MIERIHQYQAKQNIKTPMTTTGYLKVKMKRVTESQGFGCRIPGTGLKFRNMSFLVRLRSTAAASLFSRPTFSTSALSKLVFQGMRESMWLRG